MKFKRYIILLTIFTFVATFVPENVYAANQSQEYQSKMDALNNEYDKTLEEKNELIEQQTNAQMIINNVVLNNNNIIANVGVIVRTVYQNPIYNNIILNLRKYINKNELLTDKIQTYNYLLHSLHNMDKQTELLQNTKIVYKNKLINYTELIDKLNTTLASLSQQKNALITLATQETKYYKEHPGLDPNNNDKYIDPNIINSGSYSSNVAIMINFLRDQLGKRYVWGTHGLATYDCSGLMYAAYMEIGIRLPLDTHGQVRAGRIISEAEARAGDLVFFDKDGHVGMLIAPGIIIQAPNHRTVVKISPLHRPGAPISHFVRIL